MPRSGLLSLLAMAVICTVAQVRADEMRHFRSGEWYGASYSDNQTQNFSLCMAGVDYKNGVRLTLALGRDANWNVVFSKDTWSLVNQTQIPLTISFDGRAPYPGAAYALNASTVVLPVGQNRSVWEDLRHGDRMTIMANGQTYAFDLDGAARVLAELTSCVDAELAFERGGPTPHLGSPMTAPTERAAQPRPVRADLTPSPAPTSEFEAAALRIATNLLRQTRLPNARILAAADARDLVKGHGVVWTSDAGYGTVAVYAKPYARDAQSVGTKLIQDDGQACKGDFISTRSNQLIDNSIVTKALIGCRQSSGSFSIRYFIIDGKAAGWIVYTLIETENTGESASPKIQLPDNQFQAAAVQAAS